MHAAVQSFSILTTVIFTVLAVVAILQWARRRDVAAGWLALTFLGIGLIVTVGRLAPTHPHGFGPLLVQRIEIEMLVLFPYLLYRFATVFDPPTRRLSLVVAAFTSGLTIWTFALPHFPEKGESWGAGFSLYIVAFLIHWAILSVVVSRRLWRASSGRPSVAANRMRMLAFAASLLTVALIATASIQSTDSVGALLVQVLAALSGVAFLLGIAPPALVRSYWRAPAQRELQRATRELMTMATTREEVAARVVPSIAAIVGARAVQVRDGDGRTVATEGAPPEGEPELRVDAAGASVLVWTSPYAPFFGEDEVRLLSTLAAFVGIALDRVRLFEQERDSRIALQHANEVMTNFIALAAHELRTPVTAIHGFVQTLNHLGARLSDEQRTDVRLALEQQTARLAQLVEQLLDLSRLDADAVEVHRQKVELRPQFEQTVRSAAQAYEAEVELHVGPHDAMIDPAVVDRIVTNLVTNAFRYGQPPVRVAVEGHRGGLQIAVEDSGPGVAPELEDTLFERFTRAGVARDRVAGTGLGLAIARAYARAHDGELRYERQACGARFVIDLPAL
jgi:signal transduction histidine kinase